MDKFDIDIVDSVKKTMEIILKCQDNFDEIDAFLDVEKYEDNTYTNGVYINKVESDKVTDNPLMQEIEIKRYADGSQLIDVTNYVYPDYNGPIVIDSAPDVDIVISTDEDDIEEDESSDDED